MHHPSQSSTAIDINTGDTVVPLIDAGETKQQQQYYWLHNYISKTKEYSLVIFWLTAWLTTNIFTLILNKYLFAKTGFHFPISLTTIHMIICSVGSLFSVHVFKITKWQELDIKFVLTRILPLAVVFFGNIVLGNISLKWISVSFSQTIKASVPFFTAMIQVMFFGKSFEKGVYFSLVPIVGGVMLATFSESDYNAIGFYAALLSCVTSGLFASLSGAILSNKVDSVNILYYMAPISAIILLPLAHIMEGESVYFWYQDANSSALYLLIASGVIAYFLNVATFFVISYTSPLTLNIAANLKVVLTISVSAYIFATKISLLNGVGCSITVLGVWWYNYVR